MSRRGLLDRVKSWFGAKVETAAPAAGPSAKHCALGPAEGGERLAFSGAGAAAVATASPAADRAASFDDRPLPDAPPAAPSRVPLGAASITGAPRLDPLDPEWMHAMEELPQRLADTAMQTAAGTRCLREIGYELEGHRQTSRLIAEAVRQLPDIATDQTALARETNTILQRQANLLESMFDGITDLRAAFKTVEESSRRHLVALGQLETCHRQVLQEYQAILLKAHRRMGRLATLAVVLAAGALGGLGYVLYLMMQAS